MRWAQRVLSAVVASTALVFITPGGAVAAHLPTESLANLAAEVTPAVVSISTHRAIAPSTDRLSGQNAD